MLALLLLFSTLAKVLFRLGLDGAFFRVHYDLATDADRRSLAGSVAMFAGGLATLLFAVVVAFRRPLSRALFGSDAPPDHYVVLAAADVWLGAFSFVPQGLLRIQDRPGLFSAFAAARHLANTLLKIVLVVKGWGVLGVLWSDVLATGFFALALLPTLVRNASPRFAWPLVRECLRFGAPKLPHGLLVQVQNLADRRILDLFVTRAELGIYQMGYTFGQGVKFGLSAFEPAFQPFVYSKLGEPDAPQRIARIATYAWAGFVSLGLVVAAFGRELLVLMTPSNPAFHAAAPLIPVVAAAYVLHGAFLLTSIGIGIQKAARYYPIVTAVAAATNVAANLLLIPRFSLLGAAWATLLSYAVMAALGLVFSQRLYPIPFEWGRFARLALAALAAFALSLLAPADLVPALFAKTAALLAFPALVVASGFLNEAERRALARYWM